LNDPNAIAIAAKNLNLKDESDEEEQPEEPFVNVNRKNQVPKKKGFDEEPADDEEE